MDPEGSLSDHRLIKMKIGLRNRETEQQSNQFNFRRVNFAELSMAVLEKLRSLREIEGAEEQATEIQNSIKSTIEDIVVYLKEDLTLERYHGGAAS